MNKEIFLFLKGAFVLFLSLYFYATSAQTPVLIDNTQFAGVNSSISFINGQPAIAYRRGFTGQLTYAYYNGLSWEIEPIITPANVLNEFISLANINGQAGISYNTSAFSDLFYARRNGPNNWSIETVEGNGSPTFIGNYNSLALINGQPAISYIDRTGSNWVLKYARHNGVSWVIQPPIENLGSFSVIGTSLAEVGGQPAISYYPASSGGALKYARFNGASWDIETIFNGQGRHNSLAVIDGQPAIAFYDLTNPGVKYARFNGISWDIQTVNAVSVTAIVFGGTRISLTEISGRPAISYYSGSEIRYARYNGSQWSILPLEAPSGPGSSLTNVNGEAGISYYVENVGLKYIQIPPAPDLQLLNAQDVPSACGFDQPFYYAQAGSGKTVTLTVQNLGDGPLEVTALNFSGDPVFSTFNSLPLVVPPGGSSPLFINFSPVAEQAYTGQLTIVSNDPTTPNCTVNLSGSADPADVPTMGQWAYLLFGLMIFTLGIVGLWNTRNQKQAL